MWYSPFLVVAEAAVVNMAVAVAEEEAVAAEERGVQFVSPELVDELAGLLMKETGLFVGHLLILTVRK